MFFQYISINQRKRTLTYEERTELVRNYLDDKKNEKLKLATELGIDTQSDDFFKNQKEETFPNLSAVDQQVIEDLIVEESKKIIPLPKLYVFLTKKKPKKRMTDIHKAGLKILLNTQKNPEGLFGTASTVGTFESSLNGFFPPDDSILNYLGLVIVKLPTDSPRTSEPIVYGFVKLESARLSKIRTGTMLHFNEVADNLLNVLTYQSRAINGNLSTFSQPDDEASQSSSAKQKPIPIAQFDQAIKPLRFYHQLANNAFLHFQFSFDDLVDLSTVYQLLEHCNIYLLHVQIERIFHRCDNSGRQCVSLSEFENILIATDVLDSVSRDIELLDAFDAFKSATVENATKAEPANSIEGLGSYLSMTT